MLRALFVATADAAESRRGWSARFQDGQHGSADFSSSRGFGLPLARRLRLLSHECISRRYYRGRITMNTHIYDFGEFHAAAMTGDFCADGRLASMILRAAAFGIIECARKRDDVTPDD